MTRSSISNGRNGEHAVAIIGELVRQGFSLVGRTKHGIQCKRPSGESVILPSRIRNPGHARTLARGLGLEQLFASSRRPLRHGSASGVEVALTADM